MHWLTAFAFLFLRESRPVVGGLLKHLDQIFSIIVISFSYYRYSSLSVLWLSRLFPSRLLSLDLALRYPPLLVLVEFSLLYSGDLSRLLILLLRYSCRIHSYRHLTLWIILHKDFPVLGVSLHLVPIIWFSWKEFFSGLFFFSSNYAHFMLLILLKVAIILATTRVP